MTYDEPERLPPLSLVGQLLFGRDTDVLHIEAGVVIRELYDECVDNRNAWGRITSELGIPWDSSAGKVLEEIRKLKERRDAREKGEESKA